MAGGGGGGGGGGDVSDRNVQRAHGARCNPITVGFQGTGRVSGHEYTTV